MATSLQKVIATRGDTRTRYYREADSQSYVCNDIVYLASNKVTILAAASNSVDSTGNELLGIVKRDGRNTTNPGQTSGAPEVRDVPVEIFHDGMEIFLPFYHATGTSAEYQDFAAGSKCVIRNQGGIWCAAIATTSNPVLELVEKVPGIADAAQYEGAWFKVLPAERQIN